MSRVPYVWWTLPEAMNKSALTIPWANIRRTAASSPSEESRAIASSTMPMWLIDEYATSRFRSRWESESDRAPDDGDEGDDEEDRLDLCGSRSGGRKTAQRMSP